MYQVKYTWDKVTGRHCGVAPLQRSGECTEESDPDLSIPDHKHVYFFPIKFSDDVAIAKTWSRLLVYLSISCRVKWLLGATATESQSTIITENTTIGINLY